MFSRGLRFFIWTTTLLWEQGEHKNAWLKTRLAWILETVSAASHTIKTDTENDCWGLWHDSVLWGVLGFVHGMCGITLSVISVFFFGGGGGGNGSITPASPPPKKNTENTEISESVIEHFLCFLCFSALPEKHRQHGKCGIQKNYRQHQTRIQTKFRQHSDKSDKFRHVWIDPNIAKRGKLKIFRHKNSDKIQTHKFRHKNWDIKIQTQKFRH